MYKNQWGIKQKNAGICPFINVSDFTPCIKRSPHVFPSQGTWSALCVRQLNTPSWLFMMMSYGIFYWWINGPRRQGTSSVVTSLKLLLHQEFLSVNMRNEAFCSIKFTQVKGKENDNMKSKSWLSRWLKRMMTCADRMLNMGVLGFSWMISCMQCTVLLILPHRGLLFLP